MAYKAFPDVKQHCHSMETCIELSTFPLIVSQCPTCVLQTNKIFFAVKQGVVQQEMTAVDVTTKCSPTSCRCWRHIRKFGEIWLKHSRRFPFAFKLLFMDFFHVLVNLIWFLMKVNGVATQKILSSSPLLKKVKRIKSWTASAGLV